MKKLILLATIIFSYNLYGQSISDKLNMVLIPSGDFWKRGENSDQVSYEERIGKYNNRTAGWIYSWEKKTIPYDFYIMKYDYSI